MKQWANKKNIKDNIKEYSNKDKAFRALLGGIGTGNISLDQDGRMCDFEVMNHPDKGNKIPYTFFALYSQFGEEKAKSYILEAQYEGVSNHALGHPSGELMGIQRFDSCKIRPQYPSYHYEFNKKDLPLEVSMDAVTPFIPLDDKNSGIPMAQIRYRIKNNSEQEAKISVCATMYNFTGMYEYDGYDRLYQYGQPMNVPIEDESLTGIYFANDCSEKQIEWIEYGSLALATSNRNVSMKPCWQFGGWWDGAQEFWQDFSTDGKLEKNSQSDAIGSNVVATYNDRFVGSLAAAEVLSPGEEKAFVFYLTWYFPNRYGWWPDGHLTKEKEKHDKVVKNYYSTIWKDAWDVMTYYQKNNAYLIEKTSDFSDALYSSNLGANTIESMVSSITVLRSTTCFRTSDGRFFGWEGCFEHAGSCPGTCTHVWNYAQTAAFLFPVLEQSARLTEFLDETDEEGNMAFRAKRYLDGIKWHMLPAVDGQLGSILRVYREFKLSGDKDFLKKVWTNVISSMEFGIRTWDPDEDGLMEAVQHNTYDIEFYGFNSLGNVIYLAALKAMKEMALIMEQEPMAVRYAKIYESGTKSVDETLYNGEYYIQKIDSEDLNKYKYQYGEGCLSDQLLGQTLAHLYGLSYLLPKEHVQKALMAIYKYNFKETLENHQSVQRTYAFADEGGLLLCSWPNGGRPKQPFVYSDEIWTGIEYHVATHLIYEGYIEEAVKIIDKSRKRYNGKRRSPYNEIECGNHYARSMAAWGILVALSGYECDLSKEYVNFNPRINKENFTCFYSNGREWGLLHQEIDAVSREINKTITPIYTKSEVSY